MLMHYYCVIFFCKRLLITGSEYTYKQNVGGRHLELYWLWDEHHLDLE